MTEQYTCRTTREFQSELSVESWTLSVGRFLPCSPNHLRSHSRICENLQQHRMWNAAIDKLHFFHAALDRRNCAVHLRQHACADHSGSLQLRYFLDAQMPHQC